MICIVLFLKFSSLPFKHCILQYFIQERTRTMENNGRECQESLEAFKTFYDQLGPTMTSVHEVMFKLIPHNNDIKVPAQPCNGQNYRAYQRSFAILAHYFHSIFDYWKQQASPFCVCLTSADSASYFLAYCRNMKGNLVPIRRTEEPMTTTTL